LHFAGMKKLSTNDKLHQILSGPDDDEDDASQKAQYIFKESEARRRLRRTSLYGQGAKAKMPKVRKSEKKLKF